MTSRTTGCALLAVSLSLAGCIADPDGPTGRVPTKSGGQTADGGSADAGPADAGPADAGPAGGTPADAGSRANRPPVLTAPGPQTVNEEEDFTLALDASDDDGDDLVFHLIGAPAGARFDPLTGVLTFRPDFIEGGDHYALTACVDDASERDCKDFTLDIVDTVRPLDPVVLRCDTAPEADCFANFGGGTCTDGFCDFGDHVRYIVRQGLDPWLASPGRIAAGEGVTLAAVSVPKAASSSNAMPVRIFFHGFQSGPFEAFFANRQFEPNGAAEFTIAATDEASSQWFGYASSLDSIVGGDGVVTPKAGPIVDYTSRRVLHLLDWTRRTFAGVDLDRAYTVGFSMGGAGSAHFGVLHARHLAFAFARVAEMNPHFHKPARTAQLTTIWGGPDAGLLDITSGVPVWDRLDLTRALRDEAGAEDAYLSTKHNKNNEDVLFSSVLFRSAITGLSYYEAVEQLHVGHVAFWDEADHIVQPDPVLGEE